MSYNSVRDDIDRVDTLELIHVASENVFTTFSRGPRNERINRSDLFTTRAESSLNVGPSL